MRTNRIGALESRGNSLKSDRFSTLDQRLVVRLVSALTPFPGNPRRHPKSQLASLARSIAHFGFTNPILVDENMTILAGHGRLLASKLLGMTHVPTLMIKALSDADKRALVIMDNKSPEQSVWDFDLLKGHFKVLNEINYDVELTGFTTGEVDLQLDGKSAPSSVDPADDLSAIATCDTAVSQLDDIWILGPHKILCGNALEAASYRRLLRSERAQMVVTDPPFNVSIKKHARGRSQMSHREFAMASGEMSEKAYLEFLSKAIALMVAASADGSIHYHFIDWRHLMTLQTAALPHYSEQKNLLVWRKTNAGQGNFYRNQHELIAVFKVGDAKHINNFGLGANGRYRTNVLDCPSVNSFHPARRGEKDLHPTVKPLALIADLIRDCSRRNGLILDPFGGSGSALLGAERTGRIARLIELDPLYVDLTVRRWTKLTGLPAYHQASGQTFSEREDQITSPPLSGASDAQRLARR